MYRNRSLIAVKCIINGPHSMTPGGMIQNTFPGRHPVHMPQPPQLAPLDVEEEQFQPPRVRVAACICSLIRHST